MVKSSQISQKSHHCEEERGEATEREGGVIKFVISPFICGGLFGLSIFVIALGDGHVEKLIGFGLLLASIAIGELSYPRRLP